MAFRNLTEAEVRQAFNANEIRKMESSRWDGRCALCGGNIAAYSEPIYYLFAESVKQITHVSCATTARDNPPGEEENGRKVVRENPYRANSKRGIIVNLALQGKKRSEIYDELKPMITGQIEPMVYKENVSGKREPLPIGEQYKRLWSDIARKLTDADRIDQIDEETREEIGDETPKESKPRKAVQKSLSWPDPEWIRQEIETLLSEVTRLRRFFKDRGSMGGQEVEEISMRPVVYGRRMIRAGIPAKVCLYALTMHLAPETRQAAGIETVDFLDYSEDMGEGTHKLLGYALKLAKARVPIFLVGPKGSGKSTIARQMADALGVEYGECPLTAGATPAWLLGRYIDRYIPSDYMSRYDRENGGGVFCFEEIDSADANMLLVVNNSLASDSFHNPISGTTVKKSDDFIPVATGNTFGTGATAQYGGREKLDAATRDRWAMGRVFVPVDEELETSIAHESYDAIQ